MNILSIEFSHRGVYYDLTVPDGEHYAADGAWSHNSGKTRTGSEYTRYIAKKIPYLALIGPTGPAVRSVMIEGESGLIAACERAGESYHYEPSKQRFTFEGGARAQLFSAEEPDRIRGHQFGFVWADENAHWADPKAVWDMMILALRLGRRPHVLATTTPIPSEFMKELVADPDTVRVVASTYANIENLSEVVVRKLLQRYEGTFLGRQEIYGEIIDDREGALWKSEMLEYVDISTRQLERVVVGIDPAGSQGAKSDITGIVAAGKQAESYYVLADASGKFSPTGWARAAINLHDKLKADAIVVERNFGGDMCRATLRAEEFDGRIIEAKATDGKRLRAEPISALYEQRRVFHARAAGLEKLESELVSWIPGEGKSPNRLDAMVWAITSLNKRGGKGELALPSGRLPRSGPRW